MYHSATTLLLTALAAVTGVQADYATQCVTTHPLLYAMIENFCAKSDMVCPSNYCDTGIDANGFWIGIQANCNPPKWIPTEWCLSQMHEVCAKADSQGNMRETFDMCQTFVTWNVKTVP
ncbi:hypothetical protein EJ03DRAFT_351592 [Teratosphaeria nubilosa]|uniref:Extracellular membrane protein CFEM domain-containing protein n=1 Tax=Teratosphaeria nubilosa TaxID=161662 RepID=A0A6G1L8C0_9PEZI|nr:hypothetical protein EJ03DRAFT_351592 [Teratosphaeria nubilosa]